VELRDEDKSRFGGKGALKATEQSTVDGAMLESPQCWLGMVGQHRALAQASGGVSGGRASSL
jgi:hypothetical protein